LASDDSGKILSMVRSDEPEPLLRKPVVAHQSFIGILIAQFPNFKAFVVIDVYLFQASEPATIQTKFAAKVEGCPQRRSAQQTQSPRRFVTAFGCSFKNDVVCVRVCCEPNLRPFLQVLTAKFLCVHVFSVFVTSSFPTIPFSL
jgi:hypothetical protein